jgi:hypothetical protein
MEISIHFWSYFHISPGFAAWNPQLFSGNDLPSGDQQCHWSSPQGRDNLKLVAEWDDLGMILGLPWEYHGNTLGISWENWDFTSNYGNIPSGKR